MNSFVPLLVFSFVENIKEDVSADIDGTNECFFFSHSGAFIIIFPYLLRILYAGDIHPTVFPRARFIFIFDSVCTSMDARLSLSLSLPLIVSFALFLPAFTLFLEHGTKIAAIIFLGIVFPVDWPHANIRDNGR